MGIRETIRKSKPLALVLASLMIVGGAVAIYVQARGMGPSVAGSIYITEDDGKTYTPGTPKQLRTLGKNGQPVVQAHVFTCGGKPVVGYLTRYSEDAVKLMIQVEDDRDIAKKPEIAAKLSQIPRTGMELKKPGDAAWVPQADVARVSKIRPFVCPDGTRPGEMLPD